MKKTNILSVLFMLLLTAVLITGCANSTPEKSGPAENGPYADPAAVEETDTPETETETDDTRDADASREIEDMAGRTVTVPAQIEKVWGTDPVATITLYTIDTDLLTGLNYGFSEEELRYLTEDAADLPVYGMRDNLNTEAVIEAAPDICLAIGKLNDTAVETADALQEQLNIPVVIADGSFDRIPEMYQFVGELLGKEEAADVLAAYAQDIFDKVDRLDIAEEDRLSFYYGNGIDSLETVPASDSMSLEFEMAGAVNSVDTELEGADSGRAQISAEQLLAFNPDIVFLNGEPKEDVTASDAVSAFTEKEEYASITAVQEGRVYAIPTSPFSWVERPQSVNRLIGLLWTSHVLYPEAMDGDITAEIIDFYETFYHVTLTEDDVTELLGE